MNETQTSAHPLKSKVEEFSYFKGWKEEVVAELCQISKIKKFKPDEIIFGGRNDLNSYVYFITEGCCRVIECVELPEKTKNGIRTRTIFAKVGVLYRLSCFNIGENLQNRQIVAILNTECLLIPFYWLLEHNEANIWMRIKQFLTWNIPKTERIIENILNAEKWKKHKKKLIQRKMKRKVDTIEFYQLPYSLMVKY